MKIKKKYTQDKDMVWYNFAPKGGIHCSRISTNYNKL